MGAGAPPNAFQSLGYANLFTQTQAESVTPPRRLLNKTAATAVPANGVLQVAQTIALSDQLNAQQDGFLFDQLSYFFAPGDNTGHLTLTDLHVALVVTNPALAIVLPIGSAFPTLLVPRNAPGVTNPLGGSGVFISPPGLLTGDDMLTWFRLENASNLALPTTTLSLFVASAFANNDAAAHNISTQVFARYRKVTGLQEG